jgi:hypothetical protein
MPIPTTPNPASIPVTTIASGSNGQPLAQATIHVGDATGFALPAGVTAANAYIPQLGTTVNYTGTGSGTLTGCTGGSGTLVTGMLILSLPLYMRMVQGDDPSESSLVQQQGGDTTAPAWLTLQVLLNLIYGVGVTAQQIAHPGTKTRTVRSMLHNVSQAKADTASISMATGDTVEQVLDLPDGAVLTQVVGYIKPGGHSALPATMPTLQVAKLDITTGVGVGVVGGPVTDSSANTTAYDPAHGITVSGMSEVIDNTHYLYLVTLLNESGANSAGGGEYVGTTWTAVI